MKLAIVRYFVLLAVAALGCRFLVHWSGSELRPARDICHPLQGSGSAVRDPESWPREVKNGDKTFLVHQPQFDSWDGRKVEALCADRGQGCGK